MRYYIKQHDKDKEMLEIFSFFAPHGKTLTNIWAVVHNDFIDDVLINNPLSEGNTVEISISIEGLLDE